MDASEQTFRQDLVAAAPALRAYALKLVGNVTRAEDLVQETLLRALANRHLFQMGTNMRAWLFTIERNFFKSEYRDRQREVEDIDEAYAKTIPADGGQQSHLQMQEFVEALPALPAKHQMALILVGAEGYTYEEAAEKLQCPIGSIKSNVNRARTTMQQLLSTDSC